MLKFSDGLKNGRGSSTALPNTFRYIVVVDFINSLRENTVGEYANEDKNKTD